jgi:hypothetical protein
MEQTVLVPVLQLDMAVEAVEAAVVKLAAVNAFVYVPTTTVPVVVVVVKAVFLEPLLGLGGLQVAVLSLSSV